jgi:uncharacterized membrane protein YgdD (TMEM256/DUF423 family)
MTPGFLSRTSKSIGSKTAILIALNSVYEILHQSSHFFYFFIAATGINYIPLWISMIFNGIPLIGFSCALNMLTLSLDRLFAVLAPLLSVFFFLHFSNKQYSHL